MIAEELPSAPGVVHVAAAGEEIGEDEVELGDGGAVFLLPGQRAVACSMS